MNYSPPPCPPNRRDNGFGPFGVQTGLLQIINGGKPVILSTGHSGVEPEVVRAALAEPDAQVGLE